MATIFTQDAVLHFLQNHGGSVKNSDLLLHFRIFIRNHADQDRNRELFKKYVNSVATVKQQEGVSYVVLRKKFRGHIQDDVGEVFNMTARLSAPQSSESGRTGRTEEQRLKPQLSYAATAAASEKTPAQIMPVAGIVINNIIQTKLNPKQSQQRVNSAPNPSGGLAAVQVVSQVSEKTDRESNLSKPVVQDRRSTVAQHGVGVGLHPAVTPGISTGRHYWEDREQVSVCHSSGGREVCQQYEAGPGQETPLSPQFAPRCFRYRQSYKSAISYDEDDKVTISAPLGDTGRTISTSLPCIIDTLAPPLVVSASSSPSERNIPKIHIQDVEEKVQPLCYPDWGFESEASHKYIIPHNHQKSHVLGTQLKPRQDLHQPQRSSLSLSHSSKLSPSCDAGFYNSDRPPSCSSKGSEWNSSSISPQANAGELYDDHEEVESSEGSTWAPVLWQRPTVTRRVSSHLRNRMCRSLGADLDQLLQEEARGGSEAARLNRLHLISSSLSLPYNLSSSSLSSCSTPPQYCSLADLDDEKGGRRIITAVTSSTTHYEESGRQSLVPLEPREHSWLVKGAAGAWTDVYSLFREDSSLLNKHDFISGFTVLHWIAKHGDHRVLNTLWYGAQKAGLMFDINARSTCGHTPLHIAAIHGNKNIMRLLVNKFNADVRLRDMAGKKPWQYLNYHMPVDILQLLGAPTRAPVGGVRRVDVSWENQQHQQCKQRNRRQLHHFSSTSSGESRLTIAGTTKVKRSLSIAAFLKRKPVNQFHGDQFEP